MKWRDWLQKAKQWIMQKKIATSFAIAALILIIGVPAYLHFALGWVWMDWTGLGERVVAKKLPDGTEVAAGKTLWDFLELFVIPAVLLTATYLLNRRDKIAEQHRQEERAAWEKFERNTEQNAIEARERRKQQDAIDARQDASLQNYFDKVTELLLDRDLQTSDDGSHVRVIARSRTLTTIRMLDGTRKGLLLQFLYAAGLIQDFPHAIIKLNGANLSKLELSNVALSGLDLSYAQLFTADLSFCKFRYCQLTSAHMEFINLTDTVLVGVQMKNAVLRHANLTKAKLVSTNLEEANLEGAILKGAILYKVNLRKATVTTEQLNQAYCLRHVTMPDGTPYDENWAKQLGRPYPEPECYNSLWEILVDAD